MGISCARAPTVPEDGLDLLQATGWKLQVVEYIDGDVMYSGSKKNGSCPQSALEHYWAME